MADRRQAQPADAQPAELVEEEERALLERGLPLVLATAGTLHRRLHDVVEREDLEAVGRERLLHLVRRFDPDLGPFEPYVCARLKWAMLDQVRSETGSRRVAARVLAVSASERLLDDPRAKVLGPAASGELEPPDEAQHRQRLRSQLRAHACALAIGFIAAGNPTPEPVDPGHDPEEQIFRRHAADRVREAVATLADSRQRELILRHYFDGERFDHIAEQIGISKSRASRLHGQAMRALSAALRDVRE